MSEALKAGVYGAGTARQVVGRFRHAISKRALLAFLFSLQRPVFVWERDADIDLDFSSDIFLLER